MKAIEPGQLGPADGGLQIGHAVVVGRLGVALAGERVALPLLERRR